MDRRQFLYALSIFGATVFIGSTVGGITGYLIEKNRNTVKPVEKKNKTKENLTLKKNTYIIFHPDYLLTKIPASGAVKENPDRLLAILDKIYSDKNLSLLPIYFPSFAKEEYIAYIHTIEYINYIKSVSYLPPSDIHYLNIPKNKPLTLSPTPSINKPTIKPITPKPTTDLKNNIDKDIEAITNKLLSEDEEEHRDLTFIISPYDGANLSVGGVLSGIDLVLKDIANNAFCLVRPAGHHARPNQYKGFCIFNNVAIGARYAQKKYGLKNILIIDWDIHHGNGTQEVFYDDPSVLYFSIHQKSIYPGTGNINEVGINKGIGYNINAPMLPHTGLDGYVAVFKELLEPIVYQFKPELILISAGQDAHYKEKIGNAAMHMTSRGYAVLTSIVKKWANDLCKGRIVAVMEGGYNPEPAANSTAAIIAALADYELPLPNEPNLNNIDYKVELKKIINVHKNYWKI